ncbi:hypothetical protein K1719_041724 [Acacia pycnantha]|nr:hypothetical protein K1719_041724 [Acacia pycnantha]
MYAYLTSKGVKVLVATCVCESKMVNLRKLWRKMKKEKKMLLQYDIDSYSKNFDDGYSTDPENASRSFPARFAIIDSKVYSDKSCEVSSDDDDRSEISC